MEIQSCAPKGLIRVAREQRPSRTAHFFHDRLGDNLASMHGARQSKPRQADGESAVEIGPDDHGHDVKHVGMGRPWRSHWNQ